MHSGELTICATTFNKALPAHVAATSATEKAIIGNTATNVARPRAAIPGAKDRSNSLDTLKDDFPLAAGKSRKDKKPRIGRSWSMLELYEMNVIHHLQDDMEEILALNDEDEEQQQQGLGDLSHRREATKEHQCMSNPILENSADIDYVDEDEEDDFFFFDEEEDQESSSLNNLTIEQKEDTGGSSFLQTIETSSRRYPDSDVKMEDSSSPTNVGVPIGTLPTIGEKTGTKKKKLKKGILSKIGMKRSISLGIFHRGASSSGLNRMDQSSHPSHLDLDIMDNFQHSSFDQSMHNDTRVSRNSFADLQSLSHEDLTMDQSRHRDGIGSLLDNPDLIAIKYTSTKAENYQPKSSDLKLTKTPEHSRIGFASNDGSSQRTKPKPTVGVFKHCGKKKPSQSILRTAASMLDLSSQNHPQPKLSQADKVAKTMKRVTSFSTLEIREYKVTIGDNPGGNKGPPVSLDWNYCPDSTVKMCIEKYESTRPKRRQRHEMYLTHSIRMWTLMKGLGYSIGEIDKASKAADSIRRHRVKSIKYKNVHDLQYKFGKLLRRNR